MPTPEYYQNHKKQIKKRLREYYLKNKEKFKIYSRRPQKRLYDIQYREKNKEKIRQRQREYYWNNRDKILAYRKKNMAKILQYQKEYKKRKKLERLLLKIPTLQAQKKELEVMIRKSR